MPLFHCCRHWSYTVSRYRGLAYLAGHWSCLLSMATPKLSSPWALHLPHRCGEDAGPHTSLLTAIDTFTSRDGGVGYSGFSPVCRNIEFNGKHRGFSRQFGEEPKYLLVAEDTKSTGSISVELPRCTLFCLL